MQITRVTVYQVDLPLPGKPYYLSGGRVFETLDSTVVAIEADGGVTGWGESCPFGTTYLPAHALGVRAGIAELAPHLIGADPTRPERVNEAMDAALPGHLDAKSALDLACWDAFGKATGRPVCDLMGGRVAGPVDLASSVSTGSAEEIVETIDGFRRQGYRIHSVKVGADIESDIARIGAVIAARQAGEEYYIDANGYWTPGAAIAVLAGFEGADVIVEQPCANLRECLSLRRRLRLPLMLDEIVTDTQDLLRIIEADAADAVNIKIGRVGGLTKARLLRDIAAAAGLRLSIQETGGADIAFAATCHLAQSTPARVRHSLWDCRDLAAITIADGAPEATDGAAEAAATPGLGVTPRLETLGDPVAVYG